MDYVGGSTYLGAWHSFKLSVNVGGCYYHWMFLLLSAAEGTRISTQGKLFMGVASSTDGKVGAPGRM